MHSPLLRTSRGWKHPHIFSERVHRSWCPVLSFSSMVYGSYIVGSASFHSTGTYLYIHCKIYASTLLQCELFWCSRGILDIEIQEPESVFIADVGGLSDVMREYCERIINPHENIYTLTFSFIVTTASGSDSSLSGSRWISKRVKPGTSSSPKPQNPCWQFKHSD